MRVQDGALNAAFGRWIAAMSYDEALRGHIDLPAYVARTEDEERFLEQIYALLGLSLAQNHMNFFRDRVILSARNDNVKEFNEAVLERMLGDLRTILSVDSVNVNEALEGYHELPAEYLHSLDVGSLSPAKLKLKVGCPVILLRNLFPLRGLCNRTRLLITHIGRQLLQVRILTGDFRGQLEVLPRIPLNSGDNDLLFILTRKQFPVKLCFAMTINKSQGQSLATLGVDLRESIFSHRQLYVALSRLTNVAGLHVLIKKDGDGKTDNIVYPEVLLT